MEELSTLHIPAYDSGVEKRDAGLGGPLLKQAALKVRFGYRTEPGREHRVLSG